MIRLTLYKRDSCYRVSKYVISKITINKEEGKKFFLKGCHKRISGGLKYKDVKEKILILSTV